MNRIRNWPCFLVVLGLLFHGLPVAGETLFSEDFEGGTPNDLPPAEGFSLFWYGDFNSPAGFLAQVAQDGANFDDPMGPDGNKSAVFDNNNHGFTQTFPDNDAPTNITMGWAHSVFPSNAAAFTTGSIEFDIYLEPAPVDGFTYIDHRLGHRDDGAVFVSTAPADTTLWAGWRVAGDGTASLTPNGIPGLQGGSVAPLVGEVNHVRIDLTPGFHTYTLNGTLVDWDIDTGGGSIITTSTLPWFAGAPGVNVMTFVTDFQGAPGDPHGLVFIDNVEATRIPEPAGIAVALLALLPLALIRRRPT